MIVFLLFITFLNMFGSTCCCNFCNSCKNEIKNNSNNKSVNRNLNGKKTKKNKINKIVDYNYINNKLISIKKEIATSNGELDDDRVNEFSETFNLLIDNMDRFKLDLNALVNKLKDVLIDDSYIIDESKINIYNNFPDNFEVKHNKCKLKWKFNCWFASVIWALFSIKKFAIFIKNTNFDKNTEERRYNILKNFLYLYEHNDGLNNKVINIYRDKIAKEIYLRGVGLGQNFLYEKYYDFVKYKEWNNVNNFLDYFRIDHIFYNVEDFTFDIIHSFTNGKELGTYKFNKKNNFKYDYNINIPLYHFFYSLFDNEFDVEIVKRDNGATVLKNFADSKIYWGGLVSCYLFTNDSRVKSYQELESIYDNDNIKKRFEPCVFLLVSPGYHIVTIVKDNEGTWRLYDGLSKSYGKNVDIKNEFKNKNYIIINNNRYSVNICFVEVFIES